MHIGINNFSRCKRGENSTSFNIDGHHLNLLSYRNNTMMMENTEEGHVTSKKTENEKKALSVNCKMPCLFDLFFFFSGLSNFTGYLKIENNFRL